jgi:hypothetical protein
VETIEEGSFPDLRVSFLSLSCLQWISLEEALDPVAKNLKKIRGIYGPEAILCQGSSGNPRFFFLTKHFLFNIE